MTYNGILSATQPIYCEEVPNTPIGYNYPQDENDLPDPWYRPCPEDLTVLTGRFWDRPAQFSDDEAVLQTEILKAWEAGATSGVQAFGQLIAHDLIDFDGVLGLILDFLKAQKAGNAA